MGLTFTHASLTQIFSLTFERDRAILNWSSYAWHDSAFEVAFNIRNQIFDLGIVLYGMVRRGTKVVRRDGIGIQNLVSDFEEASG